ncbi:MAG: cytochrome c, partial [Deltaproteobacteria bacterium]|nr:cytochrome c [Deltaproteobacteria bacterium]
PIPNWNTAAVHGATAKLAPGSSGFASCQICHGNNFTGANIAPTCLNNATCHGAGIASPHPRKPWRGVPYTHTDTDNTNAPVCAKCHFPGSTNNPPNHPDPATPAPAGSAPGCFNNTLCHGENPVPHAVDNDWAPAPPAAQPHGNDAKAAAGDNTGFSYCQDCHGTGTTSPANFGGGSSGVDCYFCHGVSAPHAPAPWRASVGSPYTHTITDPTNAPVCAQCHSATPAPDNTAPGCFNSTLCHGPTFHPPGWDQATQHGPVAKQAPSSSGGFAFCQLCHGTGTTPPANFGGGSVGISCYPCHGNVGTPHPGTQGTWRGGDPPTHRTTNQDPSNLNVCAQCHLNGANSPLPAPPAPAPGTLPGCFNNTLCH